MATVTRLDPAPRAQIAPLLVVDDIVKHFETPEGVIPAVDQISLDLALDEFLAVISRSGCATLADVRVEADCTPAMTAAVSNAERK